MKAEITAFYSNKNKLSSSRSISLCNYLTKAIIGFRKVCQKRNFLIKSYFERYLTKECIFTTLMSFVHYGWVFAVFIWFILMIENQAWEHYV